MFGPPTVLAFLLLTGGAHTTTAEQATPPIRACSLLPRDLVMKVSGAKNKLVFDLPPEEEAVGKGGSACHYADITLQVDVFTPDGIDGIAKRDNAWSPVPGVGDRAYFRNNKDNFAEVMARV